MPEQLSFSRITEEDVSVHHEKSALTDDHERNAKREKQVSETKVKSDVHTSENSVKEDGNQPVQEYTTTNLPTIDMRLPKEHSETRSDNITHIVIHYISNAAAKPKDPYQVQDIRNIFLQYGVSTHYLIGREGEIYLFVPESRVAYHAGKGKLDEYPYYKDKLNHYSIGIELMAIGTEEEMSTMMPANVYRSIEPSQIGFTQAQYETLHRLIDDIVKRNPHIKRDRTHIIGHDEYAPARKTDPGSLFQWSSIGF